MLFFIMQLISFCIVNILACFNIHYKNTKYSKVYGPKNFTPIPDVLPSSPDFDACLGVIENEIMQLEDGTYFFGSTPVSAIEFNSYLQNLE